MAYKPSCEHLLSPMSLQPTSEGSEDPRSPSTAKQLLTGAGTNCTAVEPDFDKHGSQDPKLENYYHCLSYAFGVETGVVQKNLRNLCVGLGFRLLTAQSFPKAQTPKYSSYTPNHIMTIPNTETKTPRLKIAQMPHMIWSLGPRAFSNESLEP